MSDINTFSELITFLQKHSMPSDTIQQIRRVGASKWIGWYQVWGTLMDNGHENAANELKAILSQLGVNLK